MDEQPIHKTVVYSFLGNKGYLVLHYSDFRWQRVFRTLEEVGTYCERHALDFVVSEFTGHDPDLLGQKLHPVDLCCLSVSGNRVIQEDGTYRCNHCGTHTAPDGLTVIQGRTARCPNHMTHDDGKCILCGFEWSPPRYGGGYGRRRRR